MEILAGEGEGEAMDRVERFSEADCCGGAVAKSSTCWSAISTIDFLKKGATRLIKLAKQSGDNGNVRW